jgi:hypothetical protein
MKSIRFWILATFLLVSTGLLVMSQHEPLQAQGRRLPPSSPWEYKIIRTGAGGGQKSLEEAGEKGWECVGFAFSTSDGRTNGECFVLKRPKIGT